MSLLGLSYNTRLLLRTTDRDCGSSCRQLHDFRPETTCHPHKRQSLPNSGRAGHSWYSVMVHCIHARPWYFCILNKANVKSFYVLKSRSPALRRFRTTALEERIQHCMPIGESGDWSPYPRVSDPNSGSRWLQKFNGNLLVQGYISEKSFMTIRSVIFKSYESHCEKMPYLAMLRNPFQNSWIQIRRRMSSPKFNSSLSTATPVVNFSRRSVQYPFSSCYRAACIACTAV